MTGRTVLTSVYLAVLVPLAAAAADPSPGALQSPATQPSATAVMERYVLGDVSSPATQPEVEAASKAPRLVPVVDYSGDLWKRAALTGDWGGVRKTLSDKGVKFSAAYTQLLQGNIEGGLAERTHYSGGLKYRLDMDLGPMGLMPGGMLVARGMTNYGSKNNLDAGNMMPVNYDGLYPVPGESSTCLTDLYYIQFVAPWLGFMVGKTAPEDTNVFAHDPTSQFMNVAFNLNPALITTVPQDFLTAAVIVRPTEWLMLTTMVLDSEGEANVSGFDTAFDRGMTLYQQLEVSVNPFKLPGHQRLSWSYSDKVRTQFNQDIRGLATDLIKWKLGKGPKPNLSTDDEDWSFMYDFDQYLYVVPGSKDRGFGFFGRYGCTSGQVNPIQNFYSIGLGGKGLMASRPNDTYGVGYYLVNLSDQLHSVINQLPRGVRPGVEDEQGVEIYYNIEIAPWLHLTPDLQIIRSARSSVDTAVVGGLRLRMDF